MSARTLIRSARVIDGTGTPWFRADLLIEGGRIAAIGPGLAAPGAAVVDAEENFLAPGFIDAHCHDDLITLREPLRPEKLLQGVTTVVVGNCSFSLYPATPASVSALARHFGALLGDVAADEVFADLDAYRRALHGRGMALNLVSLVGHAALRYSVMGTDARPATATEREAMVALLGGQLAQGAAGLSLGLVYPPSAMADAAELEALAAGVRAGGGLLAAHVRSYEAGLGQAVDEFLALLRRSGAAGLLSHLQAAGRPNWGRVPAVLQALEAARSEGIDVAFDMYPYLAGSSYLQQLLPPAALADGLAALLGRLGDAVAREALRRQVEEGDPAPGAPQAKVALIGWGNVMISGVEAPSLKHLEGMRFDAAAAAAGLSPFDLLLRLLEADGGRTAIVMFQLHEDDLRAACCHRLHMFGSDGLPRPGTKPHPRAWGTFPRVVERLAGGQRWLALEEAVRHMTSAPAGRFRLADRGVLRAGMVADLVLFRPELRECSSFEAPERFARGVVRLWVAGEAVVAEGAVTGRRPGRVLRPGATGDARAAA